MARVEMAMDKDRLLRAWSHFLGTQPLAVRAIERRLAAAGQPPFAWYDVLLELERAGGRERIGTLAEKLVVEPYNMTRLLDRLERAGLLRRERATGDRRGALAVLTDAGRTTRRRMWPLYEKAILEVFSSLTDNDAESLIRIMKKVIEDLREDRSSPRTDAKS
jgi:DNA-binding MarR family transcriptional regulator